MNKHFQLRTLFDQTTTLIIELKHALREAEVAFCHYYQLPKPTVLDEKVVADRIDVIPFQSQQAFECCLSAFDDVFKKPSLSGKVLTRHPGVIGIRGSNSEIRDLLNAINQLKHRFKQLVLSEKNKDDRFELVHSAVPNLITLAFYRQLHFEQRIPFSLRFTWMHKHSIQYLSTDSAKNLLLEAQQSTVLPDCDLQNWQKMIAQELYRISHLPSNHKLRIRRPIRVSPQVNIRFSASDRYHVSAALPFILFNAEQIEKVGELPNYTKKADPRQKKSHYLIERLFLESKQID